MNKILSYYVKLFKVVTTFADFLWILATSHRNDRWGILSLSANNISTKRRLSSVWQSKQEVTILCFVWNYMSWGCHAISETPESEAGSCKVTSPLKYFNATT